MFDCNAQPLSMSDLSKPRPIPGQEEILEAYYDEVLKGKRRRDIPSFTHLGLRINEVSKDITIRIRGILKAQAILNKQTPGIAKYRDKFIKEVKHLAPYEIVDSISSLSETMSGADDKLFKFPLYLALEEILNNISVYEFAQHGVVLQTYKIEEEECDQAIYSERTAEIMYDFLKTTVISGESIKTDNVMQAFYYAGSIQNPERLVTKFSSQHARININSLVVEFSERVNCQSELIHLIEMIDLTYSKLSHTMMLSFKCWLVCSLRKRSFFNQVISFINSGCYISSTHGLQRLCRRTVLASFLITHVQHLIYKLRTISTLDDEEETEFGEMLTQAIIDVLSLPDIEVW